MEAPPVEEPHATDPPPPEAQEPPAPTVVLHTDAELDAEPGPESITLTSDGALVAGALRGTAELTGAHEVFMQEAAIEVVDLDRRRHTRAILVQMAIEGDEDPPERYQLFVAEGAALRRVLDVTLGVYGGPDLVFPGDGTIRYEESGWMACERARAAGATAERAPIERVVLRPNAEGVFEERRRTRSGRQQICSELAACPAVYVETAGGSFFAGEILRDLRGARAYASQTLELGTHEGLLSVELREEKPEITFLDAIHVEVGGVSIAPRACASPTPPAYCGTDHVPFELREGESIALEFELPPGVGSPILVASGYYTPTAAR